MFTFSQSLTLFKRRLFSITGRSTRAEFWWLQLVFYIASFILQTLIQFVVYVPYGLEYMDSYYMDEIDTIAIFMSTFGLALLVGLIFFLLNFSLMVRRLHDCDFSGWWLLLLLIPIIGNLVIFVFTLLPSNNYINRFGADPTANPPAHFDFYTKQYYKFFGAFGLHPEMPGYPQYPNYTPWGQYSQNQYGSNQWGQNQYGSTPNFNQPGSNQYGQNQYGSNQWNQNQYGSNPNFNQPGSNQYGQNQYGQNQWGQNQYGSSPNFNQSGSNQSGQNQYGPNQWDQNSQGFNQSAQSGQQPNQSGFNPNYGFNPNQTGAGQTSNGDFAFNANQSESNQTPYQQPPKR